MRRSRRGFSRLPEPPRWPEAEEGGWRLFVEFFEVWNVAAPRIIDNNLDASHVAYVHRSTFGDPSNAILPAFDFDYTETGLPATIEGAVGSGFTAARCVLSPEHRRHLQVTTRGARPTR